MAEPRITPIRAVVETIVAILAIVGTVYGVLKTRALDIIQTLILVHNHREEIREMSQLLSKMEEITQKQDAINKQIDAMATDMQTIKVIQKALGEAQNKDREMDIDKINRSHWGEKTKSGDFTRGGGEE